MEIELVLNNLSFEPLAPDRIIARERVWGLQRTASAAIKIRTKRAIRCPENILRHFLASGYSIGSWMDDTEVDVDLRRSLRSLFSRSPYWQDDFGLEQGVHSRVFLFDENEDAIGLGVAALLNGIAISFASDEIWNRTQVNIRVLTEVIEDDGNVWTKDEIIPINHISHPNHLADHQEWIEQCLAILPSNGSELWVNRQEWFPKLIFCDSVQSQLQTLPNQMLSPITEQLTNLECYCESWADGNFDENQFPPNRISPETAVTLQQYGFERTFICPDGQSRTFSWHLKLTPANWRIHFYPIPVSNQIIVGYVGKHLRTARFNN